MDPLNSIPSQPADVFGMERFAPEASEVEASPPVMVLRPADVPAAVVVPLWPLTVPAPVVVPL